MDLTKLSDDELWETTMRLAVLERAATADLIEHLAEIDRRSLPGKRGYCSLFEYCTHALKMTEGTAYRRIRSARSFKLHPPVIDMLRDGRLTLEGLAMLHPHLRAGDAAELVAKSAGLRIRQLEAMLAERDGCAPSRDVIRAVGTPSCAASPAVPAAPSLFDPPSETGAIPHNQETDGGGFQNERVSRPPDKMLRFAFTANRDFYVLLEKARSLLRHKYPDGRLEGVLGDALTALLEKRDPVLRWKASRRSRG